MSRDFRAQVKSTPPSLIRTTVLSNNKTIFGGHPIIEISQKKTKLNKETKMTVEGDLKKILNFYFLCGNR